MLAQSRRELIPRTLRADGPSEVRSLADKLGASQATISRDLEQLDADCGVACVCGPDDRDVVTTASADLATRLALQEAGVDMTVVKVADA